jgi:hypothetical protein
MEIDLSETIPLLPRERALTFPFSWKSKQKSRGFPVFVVKSHFILLA